VTMREQGMSFVNTVKHLMQLLLEYRAVVACGDNRDSDMCCTVNLLVSSALLFIALSSRTVLLSGI
jgi:hypothetical protein